MENNWTKNYTEFDLCKTNDMCVFNAHLLYVGINVNNSDFYFIIKDRDTDHYTFALIDLELKVIFDDIYIDDFIPVGYWTEFINGKSNDLILSLDWKEITKDVKPETITSCLRKDYIVNVTKVI